MLIKGIEFENFGNYKKPSMFIAFPSCSFKCDREAGCAVCQNGALAQVENIDVDIDKVVEKYKYNNISQALVLGGLEPFDSWEDVIQLVHSFRAITSDEIIIYTGYGEEEIVDQIKILSQYNDIIIKFGRFIPNHKPHYDELLGLNLASDNQYAKKIS